jgi:hypothetical protein
MCITTDELTFRIESFEFWSMVPTSTDRDGLPCFEAYFSKIPCDICNSILYGDRYDYTCKNRFEDTTSIHTFSICVDCMQLIER